MAATSSEGKPYVAGRIAIDATNIRAGGGITHLRNLIERSDPQRDKFESCVIWASPEFTSLQLQCDWITILCPWWAKIPLIRFIAVQLLLPRQILAYKCEMLLSPGGTIPIYCRVPTVAICQNMLPFERTEGALFGYCSLMFFKLAGLSFVQSLSFARASGVIFLSCYARTIISNKVGIEHAKSKVIHHGVEERFFFPTNRERKQNGGALFKLVYVSIFLPYKHQLEVVRALQQLASDGKYCFELSLVGKYHTKYGRLVYDYVSNHETDGCTVKFVGELAHNTIESVYQDADGAIFASSCENLPNILLETMASNVPLVCSDRGPMPEVVEGKCVMFDPYDIDSIKSAVVRLVDSKFDRVRNSELQKIARKYSWEVCAKETVKFCLRSSREARRKS